MKKYNKLILSLVLGAGVVATFGASYALYKNIENAEDKTITIGSVLSRGETTGNVNYSFDTVKSYIYDVSNTSFVDLDTAEQKLSPMYNQIKIVAPLTFAYESSVSAFEQSYALGRLSVSISIDKALPAGTKAYAYLTGYSGSDDGSTTNTYFYTNKRQDFFNTTFTTSTDESSNPTNTLVSKFIDTAIPKTGISCEIVIDFGDSITSSNFLNLAELSSAYNVTLNWGGYKSSYTDFDTNLIPTAYIAGTHSNWEDWQQYELVPNVVHAGNEVEWMYTKLTNSSLLKIHDVYKNSWVAYNDSGSNNVSIASDGNVSVDKVISYDLYYTRGSGSDNSGYKFYIGKSN